MKKALFCLALATASFASAPTHAGLFDDSEARAQAATLKTQVDAQAQGLVDLSSQITALREEIRTLTGQIETLKYQNEQLGKRQQDLYLDLDTRLSALEPNRPAATAATAGEAAPASANAAAAPAAPADPVAAEQAYSEALSLFKKGKYKEAGDGFAAFVRNWPNDEFAPSAQFWLGNVKTAQGKCEEAIKAQQIVLARWPHSDRAPDALAAIAGCQKDLGRAAAAKKTIAQLLEQYPDSPAAKEAQSR
ncbi:MAG: tol-pal system protein YbgF [Zoogloeaceae bacterium]|jgi:tol-pal system protein YbgF|nr:tol-pal system protein YbgF [Zoogloeaceae bacterium]